MFMYNNKQNKPKETSVGEWKSNLDRNECFNLFAFAFYFLSGLAGL